MFPAPPRSAAYRRRISLCDGPMRHADNNCSESEMPPEWRAIDEAAPWLDIAWSSPGRR